MFDYYCHIFEFLPVVSFEVAPLQAVLFSVLTCESSHDEVDDLLYAFQGVWVLTLFGLALLTRLLEIFDNIAIKIIIFVIFHLLILFRYILIT